MGLLHSAQRIIGIKDFTDMPLHKGAKIVESGGNSTNGYWMKYSDGTLLQWNSTSIACSSSNAYGVLYRSSAQQFTYPVAFMAVPPILVAVSYDLNAVVWMRNTTSESASQGSLVVVTAASSGSTARALNWIAIGRWK